MIDETLWSWFGFEFASDENFFRENSLVVEHKLRWLVSLDIHKLFHWSTRHITASRKSSKVPWQPQFYKQNNSTQKQLFLSLTGSHGKCKIFSVTATDVLEWRRERFFFHSNSILAFVDSKKFHEQNSQNLHKQKIWAKKYFPFLHHVEN